MAMMAPITSHGPTLGVADGSEGDFVGGGWITVGYSTPRAAQYSALLEITLGDFE